MPTVAERSLVTVEAFDEKQFYLDEFRGRTLLFSVPASELVHEDDFEQLAAIVREVLPNDTRVLVLVGTPDPAASEQVQRRLLRRLRPLIFRDETIPLFPQRRARAAVFVELPPEVCNTQEGADALLATIWLTLRRGPLFVGIVPGASLAQLTALAQHVATRLRIHKLVLVEPDGGVAGTDGQPISFMNEAMLATLLAAGQAEWAGLAQRRPTFEAIRTALLRGVASVNLCALAGAARELFTYTGSGTLFTLADYCTVQRLGIDDFEEVERLIERGQREGLLKLRSAEEVANMLINGYGATIGSHHMAGVCALDTAPYQRERAGEVIGLYTITRFKGEGIGGRLLARVIADARAAGLLSLFACTTEDRAQVFFEREGFHRVPYDAIPPAKWVGYDTQRKARVAVLRMDLGEES